MLTPDELARVERLCREAIEKRPGVSLVEALGGKNANDWTSASDALGLVGKQALIMESLDAAFMGMGQKPDDDPAVFALGQKLRAECGE